MWIEVDGSPKFRRTATGACRLVRTFHTDVDTGDNAAIAHGYSKGAQLTFNNVLMGLTDVEATNASSHDVVVVTYESIEVQYVTGRGGSQYRDGKIRVVGEEEWSIEAGVENLPAGQSVNYSGETWQSKMDPDTDMAWGKHETDLVMQPSLFLRQKKWLKLYSSANRSTAVVMPYNKATAVSAALTYVPRGTGNAESDPPRVMKRLGNVGAEANFLCVSVELEQDGDLICRHALFQWRNYAWESDIYG